MSVKQFDSFINILCKYRDISSTSILLRWMILIISQIALNFAQADLIPASPTLRCEGIYLSTSSTKVTTIEETPIYLQGKVKVRRSFADEEIASYPADFQPILKEINEIETQGKASRERIEQGKNFLISQNAIEKFLKYLPIAGVNDAKMSVVDSIFLFLKFSFLKVNMNEKQFAYFQDFLVHEVKFDELTYLDLSQFMAELDLQAVRLARLYGNDNINERAQKFFNQKLFTLLSKAWIKEFVILSKRFPSVPSQGLVNNTNYAIGAINRHFYRLLQKDEVRDSMIRVVPYLLNRGRKKDISFLVNYLMDSGYLLKGRKRDILVERLFQLVKDPDPFIASSGLFNLLNFYRIANSFHANTEENQRMIQEVHSLAADYFQSHPTNAGILVSMLRFLMHMNPDALKTHWKTYQQALKVFTNEELAMYPSLISVNLYYKNVLRIPNQPLYRKSIEFKLDKHGLNVSRQQLYLYEYLKKQMLELKPELKKLSASELETQLHEHLIMEYPIPDTEYVADFFIPDGKLIIEYNGPDHYSYYQRQNKDTGNWESVEELNIKSKRRLEILEGMGYTVQIIKYDQLQGLLGRP